VPAGDGDAGLLIAIYAAAGVTVVGAVALLRGRLAARAAAEPVDDNRAAPLALEA
jgi:hypothetical protein